jgi:hypothetical protein
MNERRDARDEKPEEGPDEAHAKQEERVEDLDVPQDEGEDVKGGLSLNYSKIKYDY